MLIERKLKNKYDFKFARFSGKGHHALIKILYDNPSL